MLWFLIWESLLRSSFSLLQSWTKISLFPLPPTELLMLCRLKFFINKLINIATIMTKTAVNNPKISPLLKWSFDSGETVVVSDIKQSNIFWWGIHSGFSFINLSWSFSNYSVISIVLLNITNRIVEDKLILNFILILF